MNFDTCPGEPITLLQIKKKEKNWRPSGPSNHTIRAHLPSMVYDVDRPRPQYTESTMTLDLVGCLSLPTDIKVFHIAQLS